MRMKQLFFLVALCVVLGVLPSSARAITGGQPDGNGHPYVAYLDNGVFACSGTLVSPTVLITAAHCFSDSTSAFGVNSVTGAPIVRASFDPNLINTPAAQRVWFFGSYYFDPQFAARRRRWLAGVRHPRRGSRDLHQRRLRCSAGPERHQQLRPDSRRRDQQPVRSSSHARPGGHAADGNTRRLRWLWRPELH